jgi:hypothetical protein
MNSDLNPNLNPHLKCRSLHTTGRGNKPVTSDEWRQRLMVWIRFRREGYKGKWLEHRTKLTVKRAKELAAEMGIDLKGVLS